MLETFILGSNAKFASAPSVHHLGVRLDFVVLLMLHPISDYIPEWLSDQVAVDHTPLLFGASPKSAGSS